MGAVSLLQFKAPMESTFRGELERIDRSIEALSQFTKRLERVFLDMFENKIRYDFHRLIRATLAEFQSPRFSVQYSGVANILVNMDVTAVQGLLRELLQNSQESCHGKGAVNVQLKRNEQHVELLISDSGKGISAEHLDEIFTPFKSFEKQGNLVGLGLAYVGSVVHHHDWKMTLASKPGQGTAVSIHMPVSAEQTLA